MHNLSNNLKLTSAVGPDVRVSLLSLIKVQPFQHKSNRMLNLHKMGFDTKSLKLSGIDTINSIIFAIILFS